MFRWERDQGTRELRAAAMRNAAEGYVRYLISDAAATYLEQVRGLTSPDQVTPELMGEAIAAVQPGVLDSLGPKDDDSPDQVRYKELVARSLAGYGDRISPEVLETNEGHPQLSMLQDMIREAVKNFPT